MLWSLNVLPKPAMDLYLPTFMKRENVSSSKAGFCCCLVVEPCLTLCDLDRLLCPWGFSRQEYWSGLPRPPPGDLPNPGIEPRSPALQADSLPSEPPGKPKNTGVGSLSLPQGIFLTQRSNPGLLHCRQTLYHRNHQGSPRTLEWAA